MKWRELLTIYALCLVNPVAANESQKLESAAAKFKADGVGIVLFNNSSNNRTRRAYLSIDRKGKPSLYICQKGASAAARIDRYSLREVETLWNCEGTEPALLRAELSGWTLADSKWKKFLVEMKFNDFECIAFRVKGPGISCDDWLPSRQIPSAVTTTWSKAALPIEIVSIEGPTDESDCGRFNP